MSLLAQTAAIAAKDLRVEVRGRHAAGTVLPFAATLLIAFGMSLGPDRGLLRETAPALLWLAMLFASVLAFRRSYEAEAEDGALEELLLSPVDRAAVFLGKATAVATQLVVLEAVVTLLVAGLFDVSLGRDVGTFALVLALGTVGLSAVGSLFGVLTETARARESVFPLLVLPLCIPVLVAGVKSTAFTMAGTAGVGSWLGVLAAFDLAFVAAGVLVYGHMLED